MDYSQYPKGWKTIITPKIMARDGFRCIVCGIEHGARAYRIGKGTYIPIDKNLEAIISETSHPVQSVYLQVAHLDHNKENVDPSNLATMCPIHHGRHDADHKALLRISYNSKIQESKPVITAIKKDKYAKYTKTVISVVREETTIKISAESARRIISIFI